MLTTAGVMAALGLLPHVFYRMGLFFTPPTRKRLNRDGASALTAAHVEELRWSKMVLLLALPIGVVLPLPLIATGVQSLFLFAQVQPFIWYLFALIACGYGPQFKDAASADPKAKTLTCCKIVGKLLGGAVLMIVFMGIAAI